VNSGIHGSVCETPCWIMCRNPRDPEADRDPDPSNLLNFQRTRRMRETPEGNTPPGLSKNPEGGESLPRN
jgi:hypothetical protein